jgi:Zn finger protein HypA/HybF involved in hydrogenase expression
VRKNTVIWACPVCDHWVWGDLWEPPDACPECGADMSEVQPDREAALETHYCTQFHERNEEALIPLPRISMP